MTNKTETVEEFLARGGKIETLPSVEIENKSVTVRKTTKGPATIHSLSEGAFLFSEKSTRKKTKKTISNDEFKKLTGLNFPE